MDGEGVAMTLGELIHELQLIETKYNNRLMEVYIGHEAIPYVLTKDDLLVTSEVFNYTVEDFPCLVIGNR